VVRTDRAPQIYFRKKVDATSRSEGRKGGNDTVLNTNRIASFVHTVVCVSFSYSQLCYYIFLSLQGILDSYEKELTVSGSQMDSERVAALEKNLETFR
jgi:hypothetical protein